MRRERARVAALAVALLGWSALAPRLSKRWNPLPQAVFGAVAVAGLRPPLGLRLPELGRGLRWGGVAASTVVATVAVGTLLPPVRAGMAGRELPAEPARWLLLRIPFGTVWSEEVTFRAALGTAAENAFGATAGRLLAAAVFGLSHTPDARAADESVPLTVIATGAAGWMFSWLYARSGSLAAPMLAHLAVNEAGAMAVLAVRPRPDR
ncbi:hypothetical protein FHR72_002207 [Mycolicibacterium iranicum]|uniref:CAAX prenyl protease 2/Lysostaphin resistance protein A-like domain-containing protein n=1 Tax=Mycolicibacterium iranicum TaxID=912594 RepID=A0A839Q7A2_MYCIR|nr:CPBP family intramembrane glutamic endopeptidase [Mycolicibacterium iranicum]MBB2990734.1 hypothetical protein [Mycolicibacterium iranicum]